jgi:hypothetical protein
MRLRRLKRAADTDQSRWISAHLRPHLGSIQRAWQTRRSGSLDHLGERFYRGIGGHGWIGPISSAGASVVVACGDGVHGPVSGEDCHDLSLGHTKASDLFFLIPTTVSWCAGLGLFAAELASTWVGCGRAGPPHRCRGRCGGHRDGRLDPRWAGPSLLPRGGQRRCLENRRQRGPRRWLRSNVVGAPRHWGLCRDLGGHPRALDRRPRHREPLHHGCGVAGGWLPLRSDRRDIDALSTMRSPRAAFA